MACAKPACGAWGGERDSATRGDRRAARPFRPRPLTASSAIVTLALINHPWLLDQFAEDVASIEAKDKPLAALLKSRLQGDLRGPPQSQARLSSEGLRNSPHAKLLDHLFWDSPFKRLAFLQPGTPKGEVEAQFADVLYRWRALPTLTREITENAEHLSEMTGR